MSIMKDLDIRIMEFGLYLIDRWVEHLESALAVAQREEDKVAIESFSRRIEALLQQNRTWFKERQIDEVMKELFEIWLCSDESLVENVIEADHVDLEVVGYFVLEVNKIGRI